MTGDPLNSHDTSIFSPNSPDLSSNFLRSSSWTCNLWDTAVLSVAALMHCLNPADWLSTKNSGNNKDACFYRNTILRTRVKKGLLA